VEPACAVLEIAPSTYYAAKKREERPPARDARDEELKKEIVRVWKGKGRGVYGARKVWRELIREGVDVARCTVERLMRELGIAGVSARRKRPRTTVPAGPGHERPSDLLERDFTAPAPNRRWVADITYVETVGGFVYASFILDLFSRKIVGWQVSDTLRAELALDALEMAIWSRGDRIGGNLVHHSDRGVQYTSIRYAERLGEIRAVRSVGRKGDSYDNSAAEALSLFHPLISWVWRTWMALAMCPARQGQQRSLRRMCQVLSWAFARSPGARSWAWARLAVFCEAGLPRPR